MPLHHTTRLACVLSLAGLLFAGCSKKDAASPPKDDKKSKEAKKTPEKEKTAKGPSMPLTWPVQCAAIKKKVAQEKAADLTFSKPVPPKDWPPFWTVTWQNTLIPIPVAKYTKVVVSPGGPEKKPVFVLSSEDKHVVLVSFFEDKPMKDLYAQAELNKDPKNTKEGEEMTNLLFGGPMKTTQLLREGYRHTSKDITCNPLKWKEEMKLGIMLILKSIAAPDKIIAAHDKVGLRDALVKKIGKDEERVQWDVMIPQKGSEQALSIAYFTPKGTKYADVGLLLDAPIKLQAPKKPAWLTNLDAFIKAPNKDTKQALLKELKAAKFADKELKPLESWTF